MSFIEVPAAVIGVNGTVTYSYGTNYIMVCIYHISAVMPAGEDTSVHMTNGTQLVISLSYREFTQLLRDTLSADSEDDGGNPL